MNDAATTETAANVRAEVISRMQCPKCDGNQVFAFQITVNMSCEVDGLDVMGAQPADDAFEEIDPRAGLRPEDATVCMNYGYGGRCGHRGTIAEFTMYPERSVL